jgi:hypothetical protein
MLKVTFCDDEILPFPSIISPYIVYSTYKQKGNCCADAAAEELAQYEPGEARGPPAGHPLPWHASETHVSLTTEAKLD